MFALRWSRFLSFFRRQVHPSDSFLPLHASAPFTLDLHGFAKGIDNIHIDVRLSPRFVRQARNLVTALAQQEISKKHAGQKASGPTREEWEAFRSCYAEMVEAAIYRAKATGNFELIPLVELAALKLLIRLVKTELERLKQAFRSALTTAGATADFRRIGLTDRLAWLARHKGHVRYKICRQIFDSLAMVEAGQLSELRGSLLGSKWAVPKEVLFNPLLWAEHPMEDEVLLTHYVFLRNGAEELYTFAGIEGFLPTVFRHRKPVTYTEIAMANATRTLQRARQDLAALKARQRHHSSPDGSDARKEEKLKAQIAYAKIELERLRAQYAQETYGWADDPANVDLLFNADLFQKRYTKGKSDSTTDTDLLARIKRQLPLQRRLLGMVQMAFQEADLTYPILAAYELVSLHAAYGQMLSAQELHQYLSWETDGGEIQAKFRERTAGGKPPYREPLTQAALRVDRLPGRQRRRILVQFLRDFVRLRRDLRYYDVVYKAMNQFRILLDSKNIRLSRANRNLYEFLLPQEEGAVPRKIINHIILKADVRGSTLIVGSLQSQGLNSASHFSLNFFDPINDLLELFGAKKVFVEGDAVILSLYEYEEVPEHRVSVARACGLAKRLLGVVEAHNVHSRKNGLPELELGVGLVYSEGAPTFLYDGDAPVMISAAIGKADRLSSCSWWLRQQRIKSAQTYAHVEIYEIPEGDPLRGEKGEDHLRFNVNGIELNAAGFAKLRSEITLHRLELFLPGDKSPTTLHVGHFPDLKGTLHRLVIREGRERRLNRQHHELGEPTANVFYEVVASPVVLTKIDALLKPAEESQAEMV